jgi:hypothetical protein
MQKSTFGLILAAALLLALSGPSSAAETIGPRMGVIPGTDITHDEFRAQARADLAAVALNAVAYLLYNDSYAQDFYTLQSSKAWNIQVNNMFTGRPLQLIYFEPSPNTMTTGPSMGMSSFDYALDKPKTGGPVGQIGDDGKLPDNVQFTAGGNGGPLRVDPRAIRDFDGGDIYYYTKGELLQLIMYAPDGTFVEWVDEIPNANYRSSLTLRAAQPKENVFAAQVLYYVETLAPQYYNLVKFMGDETTVPGASLSELPGSKRIELAGRIGITVLNPVTRKPETAVKTASPGVILEGTPLKIVTLDGKAQSLTEMTMAHEDPQQLARPNAKKPGKPVQKPAPGTKGHTPGAPGGGRH